MCQAAPRDGLSKGPFLSGDRFSCYREITDMAGARLLCSVLFLSLGSGFLALAAWPTTAVAIEEADRLWMVGDQAFGDKLYGVSRRALERFIDQYPTDRRVPDAKLLLGKARFSQKAYPSALEAFRQAAGSSAVPGQPGEVRFWEAETLFRMEKYADARDTYGQVLTDNPGSPFVADALYGRAWSNRELKRRDQAIADFKTLLADYPDYASAGSATYYLAVTLIDAKRPAEAVTLLQSFPTKYPGHAMIASGRNKEGLAEMRAFVAAYPDHELATRARRQVSDTVVRQGDKTGMADEYKRLLA